MGYYYYFAQDRFSYCSWYNSCSTASIYRFRNDANTDATLSSGVRWFTTYPNPRTQKTQPQLIAHMNYGNCVLGFGSILVGSKPTHPESSDHGTNHRVKRLLASLHSL